MEMVAVRGGKKKGAAGRPISTGMAYSMTVADPIERDDDEETAEQQPRSLRSRSTGKRNRVAAPAGGSPTRRRGDPVARAAMQVQQHFATDPNAIAEVELMAESRRAAASPVSPAGRKVRKAATASKAATSISTKRRR